MGRPRWSWARSWARRTVARRLFSSTGRPSGLSEVAVLPNKLTMPLRRDQLDPVAELGRTRENRPVTRLGRLLGLSVWLVSGYEQARVVLDDSTSYSTDIRPLLGARASAQSIGGLGFTDPPEHTRLRRFLTPEFAARRLSRLAPAIDRIVAQRLDAIEAAGAGDGVVDVVAGFAFPVPFFVICELLGLPLEDRERFRELGRARFDVNGGGGGAFGAMSQSRDFLLDAVGRQRSHPGEGLIGALISRHGSDLDDDTLAGLADGVFTGGYETSASTLALGLMALLRDPSTLAVIADDDAALDRVVEEMLRYLSVVQISFPRFARRDVDLFGQAIKAGDVVVCSFSGANRDTVFGADPQRFDATRQRRPHLAFGHGLHRCIGSELARMEMRSAFRGFARRFPGARLAVDPSALRFRELSIVYGVHELPVRLRTAAPAPPAPVEVIGTAP